mmetsp:Transcript_70895/g.223913  ORF Transcript_70895/g.223913 Transcript_70895/m.223913 type:complete len:200 (+) Transcript_70895:523-1122(+)
MPQHVKLIQKPTARRTVVIPGRETAPAGSSRTSVPPTTGWAASLSGWNSCCSALVSCPPLLCVASLTSASPAADRSAISTSSTAGRFAGRSTSTSSSGAARGGICSGAFPDSSAGLEGSCWAALLGRKPKAFRSMTQKIARAMRTSGIIMAYNASGPKRRPSGPVSGLWTAARSAAITPEAASPVANAAIHTSSQLRTR